MNIYDYVDKYGDFTFEEKEFNDIDNLVFCNLSYLDFSLTSVNRREHTIEYIGKEYLKIFDYKEIKILGPAQKYGYKLLEKVVNTKRYKDLIVHDYIYTINKNKQFSAMMFRINDNLEYICYEGTDEVVSGWKEDLELSYLFPIPSQVDAINYAKKHIKINGPYVIIGGHSKGGNLALVAAMFTPQLKQFRIKKVYNNDGPGLRRKEFESGKYRRIKRKYVHIVPDHSLVGILLRNDIYNVVKSPKKHIFAHAMINWEIKNDKLVQSTLSDRSKEVEKNVLMWLMNHTDKEKEKTVKELFKVLEDAEITKLIELNNFSNLIKVINNLRNIDKETRDVLVDLIRFNFFNKE